MEVHRLTLLLAVDDPALLDRLTRLFEGRGFGIAIAATRGQAETVLASDRRIDAVVASWRGEADGACLGGAVYRWALDARPELRRQFVFVADDAGGEFDRLVGGRCLAVHPGDVDELVRVVEAAVRRPERVRRASTADLVWPDAARPGLVLVEEDPVELQVIAGLLGDLGFRVTAVETGAAAIAVLLDEGATAIVAGWPLADGGARELHEWLVVEQPALLARLVFLTAGDPAEVEALVPGVPVVPKGQDSATLVRLLAAMI